MKTPSIVNWTCKKKESEIQKDIVTFLEKREWFVKVMHGNLYQHGIPDLFACHLKHGQRWIEVKCPVDYSFTSAQLEDFPKFSEKKCGIWIMQADTESEYAKLFQGPNWHFYLMMLNQRPLPSQR